MGDSQRQLPLAEHVHEDGPVLLPLQEFLYLIGGVLCPPQLVLGQYCLELLVPVRGVVEVNYGLVEGLGREILQLPLEGAEGHSALIEVLGGLCALEADAVFHKIIHPPIALAAVMPVVRTVHRGHQVQTLPLALYLLLEMTGHGSDVLHKPRHVLKSHGIYTLENVSFAGVGYHQIGPVYVPAAVGGALGRIALYSEVLYNFLHFLFLPVLFVNFYCL